MGPLSIEACPHSGDSSEVSYLVVHGALLRGGVALFSSTDYEDLISMLA